MSSHFSYSNWPLISKPQIIIIIILLIVFYPCFLLFNFLPLLLLVSIRFYTFPLFSHLDSLTMERIWCVPYNLQLDPLFGSRIKIISNGCWFRLRQRSLFPSKNEKQRSVKRSRTQIAGNWIEFDLLMVSTQVEGYLLSTNFDVVLHQSTI